LSLDEIIRFAHDIIQGMIHLHSLDIVHLDLKASNIYIGDDGKMVIGDFGQAKFIKDGIIHDHVNLYPAIAPVEAAAKKHLIKQLIFTNLVFYCIQYFVLINIEMLLKTFIK